MMDLVRWITQSLGANDAYVESVIARHGLVYLDSFVRYGQQVRNKLTARTADERRTLDTIKRDLVELHDDFRSKLVPRSDHLDIRTELTAHRHDIPIEERVTAWKRIPSASADYHTRAICIYTDLAAFDALTPAFKPSADTTDQRLQRDLAACLPAQHEVARLGTDNLAYARPGTVVLMENHEIHRRVAQILSILHTSRITAKLCGTATDRSDTSRLFKSMLIIDCINLHENMYYDPSGRVPDPLLKVAHKHRLPSASVLDAGARDVDIGLEDRVRAVRNKIAAHVDDKTPLSKLLRELDGISRDSLNALFDPAQRIMAECSRVDELIRDRMAVQDLALPGIPASTVTRGWT